MLLLLYFVLDLWLQVCLYNVMLEKWCTNWTINCAIRPFSRGYGLIEGNILFVRSLVQSLSGFRVRACPGSDDGSLIFIFLSEFLVSRKHPTVRGMVSRTLKQQGACASQPFWGCWKSGAFIGSGYPAPFLLQVLSFCRSFLTILHQVHDTNND